MKSPQHFLMLELPWKEFLRGMAWFRETHKLDVASPPVTTLSTGCSSPWLDEEILGVWTCGCRFPPDLDSGTEWCPSQESPSELEDTPPGCCALPAVPLASSETGGACAGRPGPCFNGAVRRPPGEPRLYRLRAGSLGRRLMGLPG